MWQYQRLCKCRGRGELFVLRRKRIQVSLWQTNWHAFDSFCFDETLFSIQIEFYDSHIGIRCVNSDKCIPEKYHCDQFEGNSHGVCQILNLQRLKWNAFYHVYFSQIIDVKKKPTKIKQFYKMHVTQKIAPMHRTNWTVKWPMRVKHGIPHLKMHEHLH